ncbi:MAG TPA: tetratricopeptide repeat protein [Polyangia bacterium]|jgi:Flp pilus assembly protein TadD|nr:tetratricopeptide repeat protein [Polyangia bacterium]
MRTQTFTLKILTLLTLGTGLIACDDISKQSPIPQPKPSLAGETPKSPEVSVPPPRTETTPAPTTTPEIKKEEAIATKKVEVIDEGDSDDNDSATLSDLLARTRQALADAETDRALKLAALAVKKAPKRSSAWNLLGRAQLQAGKRKLAITSFEKAVELNASNSYAQNNLGLTMIYEQRYDDAVEALEAAVELEPVEGFMWNNLGMAYEHVDRLDDARESYKKAAEMENDNARESLARLQGVKSVVRTAKVDSEPKIELKHEEPRTSAQQ